MLKRSRGVTFFGGTVIVFGIYNLIGVGSYGQFAAMFRGLPSALVIAVYAFTVFYGVACVYCGTRVLRLEDWARLTVVWLTSFSVVLGLALNRTVMSNFRELLDSGAAEVPPGMAEPVYVYAVVFTAAVTLFELAVIWFFTRPRVARQFDR